MNEPTSDNRTEHQLPEQPMLTQTAPCHSEAVPNADIAGTPVDGNSRLKRVLRGIWYLPANIAIFLVRIYQWTLSPIIGRQCRFHPSCSNYYILAVRKYGFVSGSFRGFWRICRCNPFCRSGEDFP